MVRSDISERILLLLLLPKIDTLENRHGYGYEAATDSLGGYLLTITRRSGKWELAGWVVGFMGNHGGLFIVSYQAHTSGLHKQQFFYLLVATFLAMIAQSKNVSSPP